MATVHIVFCKGTKKHPEARETIICDTRELAEAWADKYAKAGWIDVGIKKDFTMSTAPLNVTDPVL
jgi:hypothetical protein